MRFSQLGWDPLGGLSDFFGTVFEKLNEIVGFVVGFPQFIWDAATAILGFIFSNFVYALQVGFFYIMDAIQAIFRKIVGLDVYYIQGSTESHEGDIVFSLITSDIIVSVFFSVLGVAVIMLFIATFVAIIRSEWTVQGANPKGKIWGQALKSFFYFAMVPIVCILGVYVSNVLLKTLDQATRLAEDSKLSTQIFMAAAYNANRARDNNDFAEKLIEGNAYGGLFTPTGNPTKEKVADLIDKAFTDPKVKPRTSNDKDQYFDMSYETGNPYSWMLFKEGKVYASDGFNITNIGQTWAFYDLVSYNYLIGFVGGFIAVSIMLVTCLGVMQRMFELCILFVASPPLIALMPLDNGKKYEKWRQEFIKRVLGAYGPILALNMLFIILPIILQINLFPTEVTNGNYIGSGFNNLFNAITKMFFVIVGLVSVKEFSSLIAGLMDADDALKKGEALKKPVTDMAGKIGASGINAAQMGLEARKAYKEVRKKDAEGNRGTRRQALGAVREGMFGIDEEGNPNAIRRHFNNITGAAFANSLLGKKAQEERGKSGASMIGAANSNRKFREGQIAKAREATKNAQMEQTSTLMTRLGASKGLVENFATDYAMKGLNPDNAYKYMKDMYGQKQEISNKDDDKTKKKKMEHNAKVDASREKLLDNTNLTEAQAKSYFDSGEAGKGAFQQMMQQANMQNIGGGGETGAQSGAGQPASGNSASGDSASGDRSGQNIEDIERILQASSAKQNAMLESLTAAIKDLNRGGDKKDPYDYSGAARAMNSEHSGVGKSDKGRG